MINKNLCTHIASFVSISALVTPFVASANVGETFSFIKYVLLQGVALVLAIAALGVFLIVLAVRSHSKTLGGAITVFGFSIMVFYTISVGLPSGLQFPPLKETYGPGHGAGLSLANVYHFFQHLDEFERVEDIARDPRDVPQAPVYNEDGVVEIFLETKEVLSEMGPDVVMNYWTFNGQVPGPMLRAKEGDTVRVTIYNNPSSLHSHNIDLHAVTGPGGGAKATTVEPGETKTFTFKALHPGLFVYHCAVANVPTHMAHGMFGMILIEPEEGLPPVDKEFYVMQGEFYSTGGLGNKGLQVFDTHAMLDGNPTYVVFNGRTGGVTGRMEAEVGDTVRIYFGNGGVSKLSSFHVIGEVFDKVYVEGAIRNPIEDVQTTTVPAGGATIVEFDVQYPGNYVLVDHALSLLDKGAWGLLHVTGEKDDDIFSGVLDE